MSRAVIIQSLFEEIYGKLAIGYHRTSDHGVDELAKMAIQFKPGRGASYGPAAYMTYDLSSQLNSEMIREYGPHLIKFKVNLDKFLIFDQDIAQRVYGFTVKTIYDQLLYVFRLNEHMLKSILAGFNPKYKDRILYGNERFSSDNASDFYTYANTSPWFKNNVRGMVFTGRIDGRVIAAYDTSALVPIAYTRSEEPGGGDIRWKPVHNLMQLRLVKEQAKYARPGPNNEQREFLIQRTHIVMNSNE